MHILKRNCHPLAVKSKWDKVIANSHPARKTEGKKRCRPGIWEKRSGARPSISLRRKFEALASHQRIPKTRTLIDLLIIYDFLFPTTFKRGYPEWYSIFWLLICPILKVHKIWLSASTCPDNSYKSNGLGDKIDLKFISVTLVSNGFFSSWPSFQTLQDFWPRSSF